jgi:hypothetical protein
MTFFIVSRPGCTFFEPFLHGLAEVIIVNLLKVN